MKDWTLLWNTWQKNSTTINIPLAKGPAYKIIDYMKLPKDQLEPIMTNSENIAQFGPNVYSKPAPA